MTLTTQVVVVTSTAIDPGQNSMRAAFYDEAGDPLTFGEATIVPGVAVAAVVAADATDLESAQTLANANKAALNALITSLTNAGFLASS
jgi:hypothetical protein